MELKCQPCFQMACFSITPDHLEYPDWSQSRCKTYTQAGTQARCHESWPQDK